MAGGTQQTEWERAKDALRNAKQAKASGARISDSDIRALEADVDVKKARMNERRRAAHVSEIN